MDLPISYIVLVEAGYRVMSAFFHSLHVPDVAAAGLVMLSSIFSLSVFSPRPSNTGRELLRSPGCPRSTYSIDRTDQPMFAFHPGSSAPA